VSKKELPAVQQQPEARADVVLHPIAPRLPPPPPPPLWLKHPVSAALTAAEIKNNNENSVS